MSTNDIEKIYAQHIKPLPTADRLRLLAVMARDLAPSPDAAAGERKERSLMELHGLGKEIWEGVDAQEYVNELRKEWERHPAENEARRKWSEIAGLVPDLMQGADAQTWVTNERRLTDTQRTHQDTGKP